ncbi:glycoside hydrolase family 1 protein [Candidatus Azambacteria bacterium]|nr:glycoside hydrolase family 1 protein [Candidatus Azambacteria bacterium]MBI3685203.1 glycoside hydrolase family 1 protein [Candidatus Azambacteria bacterium]
MAQLQFPEGFLWGAATSSHQVEGGTHNDWSEWEKQNAKRLAHEAETKFGHLSNWADIKQQAQDPANYVSGRACDHYNRFEKDFDIAKSLGHNAHRFSIEWSRIEPQEGKWDEKEIEHYRQVIKALRARGMEPFVTLWHWPLPLWIRDMGGWENKKTIDYFVRYADLMTRSLLEVRFWVILNEPNIYTQFSYVKGTEPPGIKSITKGLCVYFHLLGAHKRAYEVIKKQNNQLRVGICNSIMCFQPRSGLFGKVLVPIADYFWNHHSLRNIRTKLDFLGSNYYSRFLVGKGSSNNLQRTDLGWEIFPEGAYVTLKSLKKYNVPIYITENGVADAHDKLRIKFIKEHLSEVLRAIQEGVDIRGYFHWSLLDNFELPEVRGFWPRFGLVEIDYKTLERKIRPSALKYAEIIKSNAIDV